jgi:transcription initiation factor TFIIB
VAGAAVYAADRLTDGKAVTQADVVRAVEATVPTSRWKISNYSRELHDASERRHQPTAAVAGLVADD